MFKIKREMNLAITQPAYNYKELEPNDIYHLHSLGIIKEFDQLNDNDKNNYVHMGCFKFFGSNVFLDSLYHMNFIKDMEHLSSFKEIYIQKNIIKIEYKKMINSLNFKNETN
jgi:hypothetical protein